MPPRKAPLTATTRKPPVEAPRVTPYGGDDTLCLQCFPAGWPRLVVAASCEHGHYERPHSDAE
jgi:hypothetical protein